MNAGWIVYAATDSGQAGPSTNNGLVEPGFDSRGISGNEWCIERPHFHGLGFRV